MIGRRKKITYTFFKALIFFLAALIVSACGGSTSSNSSQVQPPADIVPPNITFTSSSMTVQSNGSISITLSATDNRGLATGPNVICSNSGVISDGIFTAPSVLVDTIVECTATAEDVTGNSASETLNFVITPDTGSPEIIFASSSITVQSNSSVQIMLSASDNSGISEGPIATCTNGGVISDGIFTAPSVQIVTNVTCTARAVDTVGNTASKNLSFTISPAPVAKNVIVIMLDDADFSDFGFNNELIATPDAITPNMDALRASGRLLRNFYSGSGVCSPSRISLLTGKTPLAFGAVTPWPSVQLNAPQQNNGNSNGLSNNIPQLGLLMKELGKVTGHFGKWHVGGYRENYRPAALGFDKFGLYRPRNTLNWNGEFEFETESNRYTKNVDYIDYEFGDMVENFILENANAPNGFFVNYWPLTPHFPWTPPVSFDNSETSFNLTTNRGKLLAMMYSVDKQIGDIVQTLKDTGQYEDTLIILTSDNGGQRSVKNVDSYLDGDKGSVLEGGLKVSMVASWPNGINEASSNTSVISMYDLLPTLLDAVGYTDISSLYPLIDGRSKRQALFDNRNIPHDPILWELQFGGNRTENEYAEKTYSILKGNIRLVKQLDKDRRTDPTAYALYDLDQDPRAQTNIVTNNTELVDSLAKELENFRKSTSRIEYIPSQLYERTTFNADPDKDDPRLDITNKDFTFEFEMNTPTYVQTKEILFNKEGTLVLSIEDDLSLKLEVNGTRINTTTVTEVLNTSPLNAGRRKINIGINGYRTDRPKIRIYVDGVVRADSDFQSGHPSEIYNLLRNVSPLHIGSPIIAMENINYYQLKVYPGE